MSSSRPFPACALARRTRRTPRQQRGAQPLQGLAPKRGPKAERGEEGVQQQEWEGREAASDAPAQGFLAQPRPLLPVARELVTQLGLSPRFCSSGIASVSEVTPDSRRD